MCEQFDAANITWPDVDWNKAEWLFADIYDENGRICRVYPDDEGEIIFCIDKEGAWMSENPDVIGKEEP